MKKALIIILDIIVILGLVGAGYFVWQKYFAQKSTNTTTQKLELDQSKVKTHLSKVENAPNTYWVRGSFDLFWNEIEKEKGQLDWELMDDRIRKFNHQQTYIIPVIKPFANWDQNACHTDTKYEAKYDPQKGGAIKVGKPCDMTAYADFLTKAVERYDGDGTDDMPGLTIPIKYWEIMNEPEMQGGVTGGMGEELKFFVGTSQEYFDILKTSYETIKKTDSKAKVLPAGMAGTQKNFIDFWGPVYEAGAGNYFDIANIHSISTDVKKEDLNIINYKKFLEKYNVGDKPIFITEVQFGDLATKPADLKKFEILMAKSTAFSLALGADKLFYIDNWLFWDKTADKTNKDEKQTKKTKDNPALSGSTHKVYLNLIKQLNNFDKVDCAQNKYTEGPTTQGATSEIFQCKFTFENKYVYVLWGKAPIPADITGQIKVTDIYGVTKQIQASELQLSSEPVFVEM